MVAADTEINHRVIEDLAVPLLKDAGVKAEVAWVDTTDQGSLFQGADQAAVTFRTKKIDRVTFLGGARLASIFTTVAAAQSFTATYSISSFDNPAFFVNNPETIPPETLKGMVGVGFNPAQDVPDTQYAFPTGKPEKECVQIYADAGIEFESREAARVALPYCDAARLLKAAGDEVDGDLNAGDLERRREPAHRLQDRGRVRRRAGCGLARGRRRLPGDALRRGRPHLRVRRQRCPLLVTTVRVTSTSDAPVLEVERVSAAYGPLQVLFESSITVQPGEMVALLGPNGVGKSTLLKVIAGLLPATAGSVRIGWRRRHRRLAAQARGPRPLPGRRPGDVQLADGAREPRHARLHGHGPGLAQGGRAGGARRLPAAARATRPAGLDALGR